MEEVGLPERLFQTGYEPTCWKRINNYFNLRWVEIVKAALSDAQQEMLAESLFRQLMFMGTHTFSVMFAHQILSRQLVTRKLYELWWLFAGKPIRYGIADFELVTGLNCGSPPTPNVGAQRLGKGKKKGKAKGKQVGGDGVMWRELFGSEETITPELIICNRLRLGLLLLVEGILCPTSGSTQNRPEVVEMLSDIPMFMEHPWGRESFLLTVGSGKIRGAGQLVQDTLAIQGFAHAMVLVTVCSFPQIIAEPRLGEDLVNEELPIEDIVDAVCARSVKINVVTVQNLELIGQVEDMAVAHMVSLIRDGFPFEINTWQGGGGVKAINAKQWKSDGHGGGGGLGVTVDLPNLVHGLANELEAREGPLLALLKTHITQEMRSLKDEIFARGGISAPCGMADPARGDAGILNSGSPITVPRVQTRNPVVSSDTSTGCGGAEQQKHRGGQLDDGTSESAKTTQFSGGNGRGATPHPGGPITNEVAPLDSVDHCPAMGEAREDGGEETSTSDGGHGKNDVSCESGLCHLK
ncbi:hypothetical protein BRARA_A02255 [Brassica rapa]|uniref:DUF1985 domain-containing protein n=1 Tax=Brassica campestris TaxID=3711 RepID=A0A398APE7_BRACM|nr:hypothetical protein BRARA_A02255 [Brassica rapa]